MECPVDQTVLAMTDRQGIEIDYCPTCRGVWLDRGELDKLLERGEREDRERFAGNDRDDRDDRDGRKDRDDREHTSRDDRLPKKKKKSSFFTEIFESLGE